MGRTEGARATWKKFRHYEKTNRNAQRARWRLTTRSGGHPPRARPGGWLLPATALPPRQSGGADAEERDRARLRDQHRSATRVGDAHGRSDSATDDHGEGEE